MFFFLYRSRSLDLSTALWLLFQQPGTEALGGKGQRLLCVHSGQPHGVGCGKQQFPRRPGILFPAPAVQSVLQSLLRPGLVRLRRTVANEVADAGRILINGKIAKASQAVKAGDVIEVTFGNRPIKVRVLSDVEPRTKDVAREMYEIISE